MGGSLISDADFVLGLFPISSSPSTSILGISPTLGVEVAMRLVWGRVRGDSVRRFGVALLERETETCIKKRYCQNTSSRVDIIMHQGLLFLEQL